MKKNFSIFVLMFLVLSGCSHEANYTEKRSESSQDIPDDVSEETQDKENDEKDVVDDTLAAEEVFENKYMKVALVSGWNAQELSDGSVNITNGNYILYINPRAQQTSGAEGGRFSEIAQGAPGADLVIRSHPTAPCGEDYAVTAGDKLIGEDFTVSPRTVTVEDNCNYPTQGTRWYFSYLSTAKGRYLGDVYAYMEKEQKSTDPFLQFAVTLTYKAKDVDSLPLYDALETKIMLSEMRSIAKSLELKKF